MGSFNSAPKIENGDYQDRDINLPESISRNELLQQCRRYFQKYPMIKRTSRTKPSPNSESPGYNKTFESPENVRVLQWNMLSQALGVMNDNFSRCPYEALDWSYRRYRVIEEILHYSPDVICLQEVDHFNFLKHVLATQGYTGLFYPKPDSPCFYIEGNNGPDGCSIFFRTDKFEMTKCDSRILEVWRVQSNQVALMARLRIKQTGREICIITTHLKARKGALLSTLRNEQGKDLLEFTKRSCSQTPIILCGDFNAEPSEPIYSAILKDPLGFGSAYADCCSSGDKTDVHSCNREPSYTTWKIREEGEVCHTIDYVFYSKNALEVRDVLEFPKEEDIGDDRVPSMSYPSDHFSLVCDFKLVDVTNNLGGRL